MCQLTFTNLHSAELNKLFLLNISFANTFIEHKDGFGFFTAPDHLYKTKVSPSSCINLSSVLTKITKNPVMSHVRKASFGLKEISDEKAHPFKTERLVLAHNGTLDLKSDSGYKKADFPSKIDTEIFLDILDEEYKKTDTMVGAIKETYSNFTGKFAFLIYEYKTGDYYIARGETAKLHQVEIKKDGERIGFVINTQKDTLITGLILFNNNAYLKGIKLDWIEDGIKELDESSIYRFNKESDSLEKVGEIKEEKKEVVVVSETNWVTGGYQNYSQKKEFYFDNKNIKRLFDVCDYWGLTLRVMDELMYLTIGVPILGCTEKDLSYFLEDVFPDLVENGGHKNMVKEWKKTRNKEFAEFYIHQKAELEFPYFLEQDVSKLRGFRKTDD